MSYFSMLEGAFYSKEEILLNEVLDLTSHIPGGIITESDKHQFMSDPSKFAFEIETAIQSYKRLNDKKGLIKIIGLITTGLAIMTVLGPTVGVPVIVAKAVAAAAGYMATISGILLLASFSNKRSIIDAIAKIDGVLEYDSISDSDKSALEMFKKKLENSIQE